MIWDHAKRVNGWVQAHDTENGRSGQHLRIVKLMEEVGEVAAAVIGVHGQNPRKGITHSNHDVCSELADVIITAMVAMHDYVPDPERFFDEHVRLRDSRLR